MMNETDNLAEYVTFIAGGQMFGLPIERVQDVFRPANITRVPLAGPEIAGVLNLRGRIVTAINLCNRLGLEARSQPRPSVPMAIGIEMRRRIVRPRGRQRSAKCSNCRPPISSPIRLISTAISARVSSGVFRLDGQLLVALDIDRVLDLGVEAAAA